MPTMVVPKPQSANSSNAASAPQAATESPSRSEEQNSGDGRIRRKLRKGQSSGSKSPQPEYTPVTENEEQSSKLSVRRKSSIRSINKIPMGARPMGSIATKQASGNPHSSVVRSMSGNRSIPRSRQSSVSNSSQFNFGTRSVENVSKRDADSEPYAFLPPVNFDDLQSSLRLDDFGDFSGKSNVSPSRQVSASSTKGNEFQVNKNTGENRKVSGDSLARSSRTGSLIQPPSNSNLRNQYGIKGEVMGPPVKVSHASKPRRQSHFPTSSSSGSAGRAPRKSVGPGILANSASEYSIFNDNLAANADRQRQELGIRQIRPRESSGTHSTSRYSLATGTDMVTLPSIRGAKTKSMQPPVRLNPELLQASTNTPENSWSTPTSAHKSHGRDSYVHGGTPGSSKRISQMPGHATGLGARTISPTDARRMKRLSLMPNPPPLPQTPTASVPDALPRARSTVDSPSLIPRKSVTPSSNRTTPDHNRKSYNSVISISSSTSVNSIKTSGQQTRLQQAASVSRLPTLKNRTESAANTANEEGVPPVPAIPKAYESPKGEGPDSPYFMPRKSSLQPFDTVSVASVSTQEYTSAPSQNSSDKETPKPDRGIRPRRNTDVIAIDMVEERASGAQNGRRTLQPLKLPPLNLLPLNTQQVDKANTLSEPSNKDAMLTPITPPPHRGPPKTPSTPMTASKATFFTRNRSKDENGQDKLHIRSSSSHFALRSETFPLPPHLPSSTRAAPVDVPPPRKATSPFTSSSLPKTSGEFPPLRSKPSTASIDRSTTNTNTEQRTSKLTGPRALTSTRTPRIEATTQQRSPSEADGSSFGNTIRRKLSITRRRSSSKIDGKLPPKPPSHESMPPPRLPASATMNGPLAAEPSPSQKTSYLHSRRKSSHPESCVRQERAKSEIFSKEGSNIPESKPSFEGKSHVAKISHSNLRRPSSNASFASSKLQIVDPTFDSDDLQAEDEMRVLAKKRKKTDQEARELDELRKRAVPRDRVSPAQALKAARLNIYERGEIEDYKDVYFCGTQDAKKFAGNLENESSNFGYDDERGDYKIVIGDHLAYRYEVVDVLGKGSFGQVVRCVDHKTGGLEAIKIIRNKKRFHQQALVEVNILQKIRDWDPENKYSMVNFTKSFYFRGHLCISTELLGMNLYEFIKVHDFRGFSLKLIRRFTKQMLNCLVLLKSKKVIHCDLKPENILLAHPAHSEIKVIDFGSSCLENEKVYTYIQSRFYRSPEVILGMTYGMPIDMWSLGCILAELLTGYPIFPGENEQEQLACIMEVFGPPDKHLIEKSSRKKLFFDSLGKPRLTVSSKGKRRRPSSKTLQQAIKCEDEAFLDFLTRCLRWDPDRRVKPDEAIHHEFITGVKPSAAARNLRSMASNASGATSASPIKRFNSMHTSTSTVRPLPEPPVVALKPSATMNARSVNSNSPNKGASKRHSTVAANLATTHTIASARKGPGPVPTTALPKLAAQRTASGKSDLASAAAAAATTKSR